MPKQLGIVCLKRDYPERQKLKPVKPQPNDKPVNHNVKFVPMEANFCVKLTHLMWIMAGMSPNSSTLRYSGPNSNLLVFVHT